MSNEYKDWLRDERIAELEGEIDTLLDQRDKLQAKLASSDKTKWEWGAEANLLHKKCRRYEDALKEIASEDYRGNRPRSITLAQRALEQSDD